MINKQLNVLFGEWKQVMEYKGDCDFCCLFAYKMMCGMMKTVKRTCFKLK